MNTHNYSLVLTKEKELCGNNVNIVHFLNIGLCEYAKERTDKIEKENLKRKRPAPPLAFL
jgi:hypothetical protein